MTYTSNIKRLLLLLAAITLLAHVSFGQTQENNKGVTSVNEELKPAVYIDGIKYDARIVDLLDKDKIASIDVIKGEVALKKYNAPHGVILITSKQSADNEFIDHETLEDSEVKVKDTIDPTKQPVYIIDGKVSSRQDLEKLSPDQIEKINVIKGAAALKNYDAPHGVVEVTTKKE